MGDMQRPGLFLIDSFGFIFRAYHARARSGAPPMRTKTGLSTEAVYIFHNMVRKLITTYSPDYVAAVFESEGPTFREQEFAAYKANRPEMPPELAEQIPYVRRLLEAMRIPVLEYEGFEADDVIGTIARRTAAGGITVTIVSSDKDMLQLVDERISMLDPRKDNVCYDPQKVVEFMGVAPSQVADLLALKGDAVDNIPGAPGIGEKGAKQLIAQFSSVEAAIEHAGEIKRKTYRESLQNNRDQILMSKRLATIDTSVPIEWNLQELKAKEPDPVELEKLYRELEFFSLLNRSRGRMGETGERRDYRALETRSEIHSFLNSIPATGPVAVAVASAGEGELHQTVIGLACRIGEAYSIAGDHVEDLRPLLEDQRRPKAAMNVKALLVELNGRSGFLHSPGARRKAPRAKTGRGRRATGGFHAPAHWPVERGGESAGPAPALRDD